VVGASRYFSVMVPRRVPYLDQGPDSPAILRAREGLEWLIGRPLSAPSSDYPCLRARFKLAAAAYNAGPQRVRDWLAGKRTLPSETQSYVRIVTGHSVQEWARPEQVVLAITIPREMSCGETAKMAERPQSPSAVSRPKPTWIAQLIGDSSETNALARFRQLQKKHQALLGTYEPVIVRTTLRVRPEPIWTRIRVELDTRQAAESLCSRLEVVGEHCLVQRN
jgi:hypothetical protein